MDKFLTLVQKLVGDVDLDRELAQIEAKQFLTPQAKRRIRKWKKQLSPDCSFLLIRDSDLIPGVNLAICYDAYLWRRDCFSALAYPKEEKSVRATQAYERLKSCGVSKLEQLAADWLEEAEGHKEETLEQV